MAAIFFDDAGGATTWADAGRARAAPVAAARRRKARRNIETSSGWINTSTSRRVYPGGPHDGDKPRRSSLDRFLPLVPISPNHVSPAVCDLRLHLRIERL